MDEQPQPRLTVEIKIDNGEYEYTKRKTLASFEIDCALGEQTELTTQLINALDAIHFVLTRQAVQP